jgi:hypothetical protein
MISVHEQSLFLFFHWFFSLLLFKSSTINLTHKQTHLNVKHTDLIFLLNKTQCQTKCCCTWLIFTFSKVFSSCIFFGRRVSRRAHRPLQSTSRLVVTTPGHTKPPLSYLPTTRYPKKKGGRERNLVELPPSLPPPSKTLFNIETF